MSRSYVLTTGLIGLALSCLAGPAWTQDNSAPAPSDTLQTVLASVYRNNPQLLGERARLREIDENYIQARAQGRASISAAGEVSAQAVRTPVSDGGFFGPPTGGWDEGIPSSAQ